MSGMGCSPCSNASVTTLSAASCFEYVGVDRQSRGVPVSRVIPEVSCWSDIPKPPPLGRVWEASLPDTPTTSTGSSTLSPPEPLPPCLRLGPANLQTHFIWSQVRVGTSIESFTFQLSSIPRYLHASVYYRTCHLTWSDLFLLRSNHGYFTWLRGPSHQQEAETGCTSFFNGPGAPLHVVRCCVVVGGFSEGPQGPPLRGPLTQLVCLFLRKGISSLHRTGLVGCWKTLSVFFRLLQFSDQTRTEEAFR